MQYTLNHPVEASFCRSDLKIRTFGCIKTQKADEMFFCPSVM